MSNCSNKDCLCITYNVSKKRMNNEGELNV